MPTVLGHGFPILTYRCVECSQGFASRPWRVSRNRSVPLSISSPCLNERERDRRSRGSEQNRTFVRGAVVLDPLSIYCRPLTHLECGHLFTSALQYHHSPRASIWRGNLSQDGGYTRSEPLDPPFACRAPFLTLVGSSHRQLDFLCRGDALW
jgi:hypothetical protein